jgi:uncharacterized protein (DUF2249 family)
MGDNQTDFAITPETKIGALLERFPQLESLLISLSPAYKKLRNPILRKTVGKVASLKQVAQIGGLPLGELVNALRKGVGQEGEVFAATNEEMQGSSAPPGWVTRQTVNQTLDAREIINAGESPLNRILEELGHLKKGDSYVLLTPFSPAPLLDLIKKKGYRVWSVEEKANLVKTYITP